MDCLLNYYSLMLVLFHCNSLITVNDTEIFVCINDTPLLNVTFLYVSKYTAYNIFSRNFCPQERKFQGTNVPWNESSMELSSPRTRERKFHPMELLCLVTKVLRDESSIIHRVEHFKYLFAMFLM